MKIVFCTEEIITNETMKLNAFLNIDRRHRNKYLASLVCITVLRSAQLTISWLHIHVLQSRVRDIIVIVGSSRGTVRYCPVRRHVIAYSPLIGCLLTLSRTLAQCIQSTRLACHPNSQPLIDPCCCWRCLYFVCYIY